MKITGVDHAGLQIGLDDMYARQEPLTAEIAKRKDITRKSADYQEEYCT